MWVHIEIPLSDKFNRSVLEDQVGKYILHNDGQDMHTITKDGIPVSEFEKRWFDDADFPYPGGQRAL